MSAKYDRKKPGTLNLAYIIGTYPLLTTTFIDREIKQLRQWGVNLNIISIRRPSQNLSPGQKDLQQTVHYLLPVTPGALIASHFWFMFSQPKRYWHTFFYLLTRPHPSMKSRLKTILHFGVGVYAARCLHDYASDHIHAHFVDRAATLALIASRLLNIPYSATAHANDIYVNPVLLEEKMADAKFIATCTRYNERRLANKGGNRLSQKIRCIYHGLDIKKYRPRQPQSQSSKPLLFSVGQLKEKKGLVYLLKACRVLEDWGYDFHCQIVGEGPLRKTLEAQIRQLGLEDTVNLCGALPHEAVIDKYKQASIFVLPCITGADGDRDGIPNVILEAMAMELPVVSTLHSGIPEAVESGINGLLVPPADEVALAKALADLIDRPHRRQQLGMRGRQMIADCFFFLSNVKRLLAEFVA